MSEQERGASWRAGKPRSEPASSARGKPGSSVESGSSVKSGSFSNSVCANVDPTKLTPRHAYLKALAWLAGQDFAQLALRRKLKTAQFPPESIEAAISQLIDENYLSDARFAASRTNQLINRGKGPRAIHAKLAEAGVDKQLASSALLASEVDWLERARAIVLRKFGDQAPADQRMWAKRARFLAARGFDEGTVRKALARGALES
jgi:regulatory protein